MNMIYRPHTTNAPCPDISLPTGAVFLWNVGAFVLWGRVMHPLGGGSIGRCACVPLPDITAVTGLVFKHLSRIKIEWMSWAS